MLISRNKLSLNDAIDKRSDILWSQFICLDGDKAIVTNGHYLIQMEGQPDDEESFPIIPEMKKPSIPKKVMVRAETVKKVLDAIPKKTNLPILTNAIFGEDEEHIYFGATNLDNSQVITQRKEESSYHEYESVFPREKAKATQTFNVDYLIKCLQVIKKVGGKGCNVQIEMRGDTVPIVFKATKDDENITVLLMPVE